MDPARPRCLRRAGRRTRRHPGSPLDRLYRFHICVALIDSSASGDARAGRADGAARSRRPDLGPAAGDAPRATRVVPRVWRPTRQPAGAARARAALRAAGQADRTWRFWRPSRRVGPDARGVAVTRMACPWAEQFHKPTAPPIAWEGRRPRRPQHPSYLRVGASTTSWPLEAWSRPPATHPQHDGRGHAVDLYCALCAGRAAAPGVARPSSLHRRAGLRRRRAAAPTPTAALREYQRVPRHDVRRGSCRSATTAEAALYYRIGRIPSAARRRRRGRANFSAAWPWTVVTCRRGALTKLYSDRGDG